MPILVGGVIATFFLAIFSAFAPSIIKKASGGLGMSWERARRNFGKVKSGWQKAKSFLREMGMLKKKPEFSDLFGSADANNKGEKGMNEEKGQKKVFWNSMGRFFKHPLKTLGGHGYGVRYNGPADQAEHDPSYHADGRLKNGIEKELAAAELAAATSQSQGIPGEGAVTAAAVPPAVILPPATAEGAPAVDGQSPIVAAALESQAKAVAAALASQAKLGVADAQPEIPPGVKDASPAEMFRPAEATPKIEGAPPAVAASPAEAAPRAVAASPAASTIVMPDTYEILANKVFDAKELVEDVVNPEIASGRKYIKTGAAASDLEKIIAIDDNLRRRIESDMARISASGPEGAKIAGQMRDMLKVLDTEFKHEADRIRRGEKADKFLEKQVYDRAELIQNNPYYARKRLLEDAKATLIADIGTIDEGQWPGRERIDLNKIVSRDGKTARELLGEHTRELGALRAHNKRAIETINREIAEIDGFGGREGMSSLCEKVMDYDRGMGKYGISERVLGSGGRAYEASFNDFEARDAVYQDLRSRTDRLLVKNGDFTLNEDRMSELRKKYNMGAGQNFNSSSITETRSHMANFRKFEKDLQARSRSRGAQSNNRPRRSPQNNGQQRRGK